MTLLYSQSAVNRKLSVCFPSHDSYSRQDIHITSQISGAVYRVRWICLVGLSLSLPSLELALGLEQDLSLIVYDFEVALKALFSCERSETLIVFS